MTETATKVPVKTEEGKAAPAAAQSWQPFETLRREVDRLFEDFGSNLWRPLRRSPLDVEPFWRRDWTLGGLPAVDIVEKDDAFEVVADLPGMDEKGIDVRLANGTLTIKGEKREEKEEKEKGYFLQERRVGSFERSFRVPDGVDAEKIAANFKQGVLTVTLPKTAEAKKPARKIDVRAS